MLPDSAAIGTLWHRRFEPRRHAFRYHVWFSLLDVDCLEQRFEQSRWWSIERVNLVSFRRSDYIGPDALALGEAVRQRVEQTLKFRPAGRVQMLCHLRQWGVCFNPVSFYFCFDRDGQTLQAIVAEVHNTPWDERHAYVLDARGQTGPEFQWRFDKQFHVSPFLPMALDYNWSFKLTPGQVDIHMKLMDHGEQCFGTGMHLDLTPLDPASMRRMPLKFPWMTARVLVGIYWQALRLWLKRTPLFDHPERDPAATTAEDQSDQRRTRTPGRIEEQDHE